MKSAYLFVNLLGKSRQLDSVTNNLQYGLLFVWAMTGDCDMIQLIFQSIY